MTSQTSFITNSVVQIYDILFGMSVLRFHQLPSNYGSQIEMNIDQARVAQSTASASHC